MTRRDLLRWMRGLPLFLGFPFSLQKVVASSAFPEKEKRVSIAEHFSGEELYYEIGFWLFKKAAWGRLSFRETEKKGRYLATLQGETMGVMGLATGYRVDTYRSLMEEVEGGRRLRAISFEEDVRIGERLRRRTHLFDYQRRKWIRIRRKKDGTLVKTEEEIPQGQHYDDFLTASYNFRFGVYGEIERGKRFTVPTFPKKGASRYEVVVAGREEEERRRKAEKNREGKEYYVTLALDPEITHSKEGIVEGWLSKDLYPVEGKIRDVILFGDVTGRLTHKTRVP
ncbi:MAG: DUF3108 domain-containing protein [Desulfobacterota bacterium]|nr:DUF3108 domain-containing protein [Thermodesulfobacteriota bacterium]